MLNKKRLILSLPILLSGCSLLLYTINADLSKLDNSQISNWFRQAYEPYNKFMVLALNDRHHVVKEKIVAHCTLATTPEVLEQCLQKIGMTCNASVCQYSGTIGTYFYQNFKRRNDNWKPFIFKVNTVQGLQSFQIEYNKTAGQAN